MKIITSAGLALLTFVTIASFSKDANACAFCRAMQLKATKMTGAVAKSAQQGGVTLAAPNAGNSLTPSKDFFKSTPEPTEEKTDWRNRKGSEITIVQGLYGE